MIDWLRRSGVRPPHAERPAPPKAPTVTIAGRALPVEIRRLAQARRMTLRLAPDGSAARVSMPTWARQADALAFVRERHDWLAAQLVRLPAPLALESGSALPFRGDSLILDWDRQHPRRPVVDDGRLLVGAPPSNWPCVPAAGSKPKHCACARQTLPTIARGRESRFPRSVFRVRRDAGKLRGGWHDSHQLAPDHGARCRAPLGCRPRGRPPCPFRPQPGLPRLARRAVRGSVAAANRWLKTEGRGLYRLF
jgi:hypothetical protein